MIRSMTGFGRCRDTVDGLDITVEIKSVNSRYFECATKISRTCGYLEERVKPYLQSRGVARGKVDVWINVERVDTGSTEVAIDEGYLRGYLAALCRLRDEFGLRDDISVMAVARTPDVLIAKKPEEDVERDWARVSSVLERATDAFLASREREGEGLVRDLRLKAAQIVKLVGEIEELSAADVASYRERLAQRIREALGDNQITPDENRLLTECALHADKVAVDEETVRLRSHLQQMNTMLTAGGAMGRKLDFLLQEMNREANTIGSKCTDVKLARIVVDIKAELEKIREQTQNIE